MKNKKIIITALKLMIAITLILAFTNQFKQKAQAATPSGKIALKSSYSGTIQLFDRKGKAATTTKTINGKKTTVAATIKSGKTIKYYGNPLLIQGKKVTNPASKDYHYETASYINVGNKHYIKSLNVKSMDGQNVLILSANSYIYNKNGHRTSYKGLTLIPKYMLLKTTASTHTTTKNDKYYYFANLSESKKRSLKTTTINGKLYYPLSSNAYVLANNIGLVNGNTLYQASGTTTATILNKIHILNYQFKTTNKVLKVGKKVKVDATKVSGEGDSAALYFGIAGTKGKKAQYIYWGDDAEYGMDQQSTTDEYQGNFNLDNHLSN